MPVLFIKNVHYEGGVLSKKQINFAPEIKYSHRYSPEAEKSSIIESLRYALDIPFGEKTREDTYKRELIRACSGQCGKVTITAIDRFGQEYEVRRILNQQPEVLVSGILHQA